MQILERILPISAPKTKRSSPTVVQVWQAREVGGVPFIIGWLHVSSTEKQLFEMRL
jgi:hypothetical protein